jgi:hypothetical protein
MNKTELLLGGGLRTLICNAATMQLRLATTAIIASAKLFYSSYSYLFLLAILLFTAIRLQLQLLAAACSYGGYSYSYF